MAAEQPRTRPALKERLPELRRRWWLWREGLRHRPAANFGYRCGVGVVGVVVFAGGISVAPLYLVGLGILATEFAWARRVIGPFRTRYDAVAAWYNRQRWWGRALVVAATLGAGLTLAWITGGLAVAGEMVGLHWSWLASPLRG